jgi:hypothetical protein
LRPSIDDFKSTGWPTVIGGLNLQMFVHDEMKIVDGRAAEIKEKRRLSPVWRTRLSHP